jgi:hypothetical protein
MVEPLLMNLRESEFQARRSGVDKSAPRLRRFSGNPGRKRTAENTAK